MPEQMKKEFTFSGIPEPPYDCVHCATWSSANDFAGGDFYSFYALPRAHYAVLLGDVPEKALSGTCNSARLLVETKQKVDEEIEKEIADSIQRKRIVDPRVVVEHLNRKLMEPDQSYDGMFYPLSFAVFNMRTGSLKTTNAGSPHPIRVSKNGKARLEVLEPQLALGILEDEKYEQRVTHLEPSEWIVFYTDGITEAGGRGGEPIKTGDVLRIFEYAYEQGMPFNKALNFTGKRVERYARKYSTMNGNVEDEMTLTGFAYLKRA